MQKYSACIVCYAERKENKLGVRSDLAPKKLSVRFSASVPTSLHMLFAPAHNTPIIFTHLIRSTPYLPDTYDGPDFGTHSIVLSLIISFSQLPCEIGNISIIQIRTTKHMPWVSKPSLGSLEGIYMASCMSLAAWVFSIYKQAAWKGGRARGVTLGH